VNYQCDKEDEMKLSALFLIYAVNAMVSCIGLVLYPEFWIILYCATVDFASAELVRLIGTLFGGLGIMTWVGRNGEPSTSRNAMVWGLVVANGLAAAVTAWAAQSGVYNKLAWASVAIFTLFAVGFAAIGGTNNSASPVKST
jgi:hypothetical protein